MGSDDTELTNEKGLDLEDECSSDANETAKIFKIEDNLLDYETPLTTRVGLSRMYDLFSRSQWYDELTDRKLKEEALTHKARIEESWGDATPRVMKFYE
nr:hypothetical protein [Tanacetum cinerariifolium]GEW38006.1 hypothetical protein [Tanacetum cinerariifolium]